MRSPFKTDAERSLSLSLRLPLLHRIAPEGTSGVKWRKEGLNREGNIPEAVSTFNLPAMMMHAHTLPSRPFYVFFCRYTLPATRDLRSVDIPPEQLFGQTNLIDRSSQSSQATCMPARRLSTLSLSVCLSVWFRLVVGVSAMCTV